LTPRGGHIIRQILTLIILISILLLFPTHITNGKESVKVIQLHTEPLSDVQYYAFAKVIETFGENEWYYFEKIISKESNWIHTAQNPTSSANGLAQFLDSTWETVNCKKTIDPYKQIDCAILYIEGRYDTPRQAWQFHLVNNYY